MLLSVTEGDDKPLKYPSIFFKSELLVLNKVDLLPYVPFDIATAEENTRKVHPGMEIVRVSCTTREGLNNGLGGFKNGSKRRATRKQHCDQAHHHHACAENGGCDDPRPRFSLEGTSEVLDRICTLIAWRLHTVYFCVLISILRPIEEHRSSRTFFYSNVEFRDHLTSVLPFASNLPMT